MEKLNLCRVSLCLLFSLLGLTACPDDEVIYCDASGLGCPGDYTCIDGRCVEVVSCEVDADCAHPAEFCEQTFQICQVYEGFSNTCLTGADCTVEQFCALGACRLNDEYPSCASPDECGELDTCDPRLFRCIPAGDCRLAAAFPELACWAPNICDEETGECRLPCQDECTLLTEAEDCGAGLKCDDSCRCVQCRSDRDCGPGLTCVSRTGTCVDTNRCFRDADCDVDFICDSSIALCRPAPPPCQRDADCAIDEICDVDMNRCTPRDGLCADDRFEDNDAFGNATVITFGEAQDLAPSRFFEDMALCLEDEDIYAVDLLADERITIDIQVFSARASFDISVNRASDGLAVASFIAFGEASSEFQFESNLADTYYVTLRTIRTFSDYEILFTRTEQAESCEADIFDSVDSHIDTINMAPPIEANTPYELTLCGGEEDILLLDMPENSGTIVQLLAEEELDIRLIDPTVPERDLSQQLIRDGAYIVYDSTSVAAQRVLVIRAAEPTQDVQYELTYMNEPFFSECVADIYEPNESTDMPFEISSDTESLDGSICSSEVDVYRLTKNDFETIDLDMMVPLHLARPQIEVNTKTGETIVPILDYDGAWHLRYLLNARQDVEYDIVIQQLENRITPYTISLDRFVTPTCAQDTFEPNERLADAAERAVDGSTASAVLCLNDDDYYVFETNGLWAIDIDVRFIHQQGDIDLQLYDENGRLLRTASTVTDNERMRFLPPNTGRYIVRIYSLNDLEATPYLLTFNEL